MGQVLSALLFTLPRRFLKFTQAVNDMLRARPTSQRGPLRSVASIDFAEDITKLRWVGNEFVFFVDIPCSDLESIVTRSPSAADSSGPLLDPAIRVAGTVSPRALVVTLLEDMMDATVDEQAVLSDSQNATGAPTISGERLSRLVVPWARDMYASKVANPQKFARAGEQVQTALLKAITAVQEGICDRINSFSEHNFIELKTLYALVNLLSSLCRCARGVWEDDTARDRLESDTTMYRNAFDVFQSQLTETWGGQFMVAGLLGGGLPFLSYILSCQPTANKTLSVDTANYGPQHSTADCACHFVIPSHSDVCSLLTRGEIPVLAFDGSSLAVSNAAEGPYVAISHVWADGLGSTTNDGLPICQVRRIAGHASKLINGGKFWIDSLCIPSEKALRSKAIALMADTYKNAETVLVIDGGVRSQCSRSSPIEDCILRIATSGWMQRIWTLQEGMFAKGLFFELSDALLDYTSFNGAAYNVALNSIPLLQHRSRDDQARRFNPSTSAYTRCSLNEMVGLLRYRSTSHPEDEPVAICSLLGVDVSGLIGLSTREERMKALLLRVGTLHRALVFTGWWCPRLPFDNFAWAPASLSEVLWPGEPSDARVATCTEEGVFGEFCVVHFPPVLLGMNYGVVVVMDEGEGKGIVSSANAESRPDTSLARTESRRIFRLILSPYLFKVRGVASLVVNAILLGQSVHAQNLTGGGVAAVFAHIPENDPSMAENQTQLHCEFVTIGSATDGLPDVAESMHSRNYWAHVAGREIAYGKVRVT